MSKSNHSGGMHGGGGRPGEKPNDFGAAMKKLFRYLKDFRIYILIAIVLAVASSIFSITAPDRLSEMTDAISDGLVIKTKKLEKITKDVTANLDEEKMPEMMQNILAVNMSETTMQEIMMSQDISSEAKAAFQQLMTEASQSEDQSGMLTAIEKIPASIQAVLLPETTYEGVKVSTSDKLALIDMSQSLDKDSKETDQTAMIKEMPASIQAIFFPESKIDNTTISTADKVNFLLTLGEIKEDTPNEDKLAIMDKLPKSILTLIKPRMDLDKIKKIGIFLIALYVTSAIFNFVQSFIMATVANNFSKSLREKISIKINKLPLSYFDKQSIGDTLSRVTNDVDTIGQTMNQSLGALVSASTLFIGSLVMMFRTNWIMAVTAVLSCLVGFGLMGLILGKSQKYFKQKQEQLGKLNGHIEEAYSGHVIVSAYNGKKESNKKFKEYNQGVFQADRMSQFLSGLMFPLMAFIGNFSYVAVCVVGALLVMNGHITFGVIVAFIVYVRLFTSPLSQIAQAMTSLQSTAAASERVFNFVEEPEMSDESNKTARLEKENVVGHVAFEHVKFGYSADKMIIKDFNVDVKPEQKVAIVGPTGAGKTTLVNLLMRFYEVNSGTIKIDDTSISDLTRENVHDLFTMVLQDTWLFKGTVKENIVYNNPNVTDEEVREVCKTVGLDHFIRTLPDGYDSVLDDSDSVSSGQRQLLTIARGMIKNAPFLILDEATSNVDTRTEVLVQRAMDKLTEGRTSFVIAHRLSTIKNADLILVMNEGNIIEQGNHDELMAQQGFYADLYNSQFSEEEE